MTDRKIEGQDHTRMMRMDMPEKVDDRTLWISVSSEVAVRQWFGDEILVHSDKSVDLTFFGGGSAPLLLDHDPHKQIGVVEEARLENKRLHARVRFSKSEKATEIFNDVVDSIRSNVSVGYNVEKTSTDEREEIVTVTRWTPKEVSIVSIPADSTVGVGRSETVEPKPKPQEVNKMSDIDIEKVKADAIAEAERKFADDLSKREAATTVAVETARQEASDMHTLGARHNMADVANQFAREGKSLAEFRAHVLDNLPQGAPLENTDIGMSKRELADFSIMNLVRAHRGTKADIEAASLEIEACNEAAERMSSMGVKTRGSRIPTDVMATWGQRDLSAGTDTQLIPTEHRSGSFVDALRNSSSIMSAGATTLGGLSGNVDIPAKNAVSTATWVSSEGTNSTESEPSFRTISLTPNDLSLHTDMSRRMQQQSSPDIEMLVRNDILAAVALGIDLAGLEGSGSGGQPEGVLNVTGINKPTAFAGVNPTFAEVVAMESAVADDNALMGNLAYIGRTNMYGALKTTAKDAGSGQFVVEPGGTVNGYNYIKSNQGTDGNLYFGNWSDLLIGMWGGLDLMVDDAALALSGGRRLIVFQTVDMAVRHAESFCYNSN